MKYIYYILWAALCAWGITWITCRCDAMWHFSQYISILVDFIHQYGISCRKVEFWSLFILFIITGYHKLIGNILYYLLGITIIAIFGIVVVVILTWLAGTL